MNPLTPVSEIMTTQVITISPNDTILNAKNIFEAHNIHHIPVIEEGKLVGMISKVDLYKGCLNMCTKGRVDLNDQYDTVPIRTIMTSKVAKIESKERIDVAALIFHENRFHALPVIDNERLVGIVTTHDVIEHAYKLTQIAWQ